MCMKSCAQVSLLPGSHKLWRVFKSFGARAVTEPLLLLLPLAGPDCRRELLRVTLKGPVPGLKPAKVKLPPRPPRGHPPRPPKPVASPPPGAPSPAPPAPPDLPPGWDSWPEPPAPLEQLSSVTCPQWYTPKSGDSCSGVAWAYSTTTAKLQYQNPYMKCPPLVGSALCVARYSNYYGPDCLPKADGTPSTYTIRMGDSCSAIAATYQTTGSYLAYINPGACVRGPRGCARRRPCLVPGSKHVHGMVYPGVLGQHDLGAQMPAYFRVACQQLLTGAHGSSMGLTTSLSLTCGTHGRHRHGRP